MMCVFWTVVGLSCLGFSVLTAVAFGAVVRLADTQPDDIEGFDNDEG